MSTAASAPAPEGRAPEGRAPHRRGTGKATALWWILTVVIGVWCLFPLFSIFATSFKTPADLANGKLLPTQWSTVNYEEIFVGGSRELFLPSAGEFLRYRRLRDWLRLLSFEVEDGRFGCYRMPVASLKWLQRSAWMERVGERWWPVFGAVYFVVAVKRVRGMRLVGMVRAQRVVPGTAPAPVVATHHHQNSNDPLP